MNNNELITETLFPTQISIVKRVDFVKPCLEVFEEYISTARSESDVNSIYPVTQTYDMLQDGRLSPFLEFISETAWDILNDQGYNMDMFYTQANSVWGQSHPKTSSMEYHTHSSLISGFFFLSVPENSSQLQFHDPRPVKTFASLPEKQLNIITPATNIINYTPEVGSIYFTNSWLPHSVTRNASDEPVKFIHFNIHTIPRHGSGFENQNEPVIV